MDERSKPFDVTCERIARNGRKYVAVRWHKYGHRRVYQLLKDGRVFGATRLGWSALATAGALKRPGFELFARVDFGGPATFGDMQYYIV